MLSITFRVSSEYIGCAETPEGFSYGEIGFCVEFFVRLRYFGMK